MNWREIIIWMKSLISRIEIRKCWKVETQTYVLFRLLDFYILIRLDHWKKFKRVHGLQCFWLWTIFYFGLRLNFKSILYFNFNRLFRSNCLGSPQTFCFFSYIRLNFTDVIDLILNFPFVDGLWNVFDLF